MNYYDCYRIDIKSYFEICTGVNVKIGLLQERHPDEDRVALIPAQLSKLIKAGHEVVFEAGAGAASGYEDSQYSQAGASPAKREDIIASADALFMIRAGANAHEGLVAEMQSLREGCFIIGMLDPYQSHPIFKVYHSRKAHLYSLELIPRSTRAQSMDVLSSMANLVGYKSALLAAAELPKMFPLMMTSAGTIVPAKVFILGVGVAGLQAIATAKRLGAVVSAYDVRPEVKEQVLSLGAKFVEMPLDTSDSGGDNGYAKVMDDAFYARQRELLTEVLRESDAVITTAAIPGKKSPLLITKEMVKEMRIGSVVIDLAAERGGNCEGSVLGESVICHGIKIIAPKNVASTLAYHASQLFSKNLENYFFNLFEKDGTLKAEGSDDIVEATHLIGDAKVLIESFAFLIAGEG